MGVFAIAAYAADVTGKWTAEVPGRSGNMQTNTMVLTQEGTKVGAVALDRSMVHSQAPLRPPPSDRLARGGGRGARLLQVGPRRRQGPRRPGVALGTGVSGLGHVRPLLYQISKPPCRQ